MTDVVILEPVALLVGIGIGILIGWFGCELYRINKITEELIREIEELSVRRR